MKYTPFTFEQVNGEWTSRLDARYFHELYVTYGLPIEMAIEDIRTRQPKEIMNMKINSWIVFARENKIDLGPIRQSLFERKEDLMPHLEELAILLNLSVS